MHDSPKESELIEDYNSDLSEEDFDALLNECRSKTPKTITFFTNYMKGYLLNKNGKEKNKY